MTPCTGIGRILGHKFEAREDVEDLMDREIMTQAIEVVRAASGDMRVKWDAKRKTYIHDICVRCGLKVKREGA